MERLSETVRKIRPKLYGHDFKMDDKTYSIATKAETANSGSKSSNRTCRNLVHGDPEQRSAQKVSSKV